MRGFGRKKGACQIVSLKVACDFCWSLERCILQGQPPGSIDLKFVNCQGELRKTAINVTIASTYGIFIPTFTIKSDEIHVGKYISPMDPLS